MVAEGQIPLQDLARLVPAPSAPTYSPPKPEPFPLDGPDAGDLADPPDPRELVLQMFPERVLILFVLFGSVLR
jgi:hypothetical protein